MPKMYKIVLNNKIEKADIDALEKVKPIATFDTLMKKKKAELDKEELASKILGCYNADNDRFDGTKMQEMLFPQIPQTSVFLSHSYGDIDQALAIQAQIKSKNVKVFIDSLYWQSVYKIQEELSKYDPDSVLKHLHVMLITAIAQMIQSSQYFLFLQSDNSISDIQGNNINKETQSPWIYYELKIAEMLKQPPSTHTSQELFESGMEAPSMKCFFDVESIVNGMQKITLESFINDAIRR